MSEEEMDLEEEEYIAANTHALSALDGLPNGIGCVLDIASARVTGDEIVEVFRLGIAWERERQEKLEHESSDSEK